VLTRAHLDLSHHHEASTQVWMHYDIVSNILPALEDKGSLQGSLVWEHTLPCSPLGRALVHYPSPTRGLGVIGILIIDL